MSKIDKKLIKPGANLEGCNLKGVYLFGANLEGCNLKGAYLEECNLEGCNLEDANLEGCNLEGCNLEDANLEGAKLKDANLEDANLFGAKGIYQFGPMPTSGRMIYAVKHKKTFKVQAGCFWGTLNELEKAVKEKHNCPFYLGIIELLNNLLNQKDDGLD